MLQLTARSQHEPTAAN